MAGFLGVACAVVAVAAAAAAFPASGCFQTDTDYPGFDIDRLEGKVYSAVECQRQCQGVAGCEYWSYVPSTNSCYLKQGSVVPTAAPGLVSGPRVCPGPVTCSQAGIDLYGGDIINTLVANATACQYQCTAVSGCMYWTFIPSTSRCYLKGTDVTPQVHEEAVSGPRVCPDSPVLSCEPNTDFLGHDLRSFYGTVSDIQSCQRLCKGFNNCFYWTFVETTASCYLKDDSAEQGREYNPLTFSGARDCSLFEGSQSSTTTTTVPPPSCFLQDVDYPGSDITAFGMGAVTTPEACQLFCQYTRECFFFTFFEGTCYFKTAGAPERVVVKKGAVSGPKFCEGETTGVSLASSTTTTTTQKTTSTSTARPTHGNSAGGAGRGTTTTTPAPPNVDTLLRFLRSPPGSH